MTPSQRIHWLASLLALSLLILAGSLPAAAARSTDAIDRPTTLVGQVVAVDKEHIVLQAADGATWKIALAAHLHLRSPARTQATPPAVGQWLRARVLPDPQAGLLTADLRPVDAPSPPHELALLAAPAQELITTSATAACGSGGGNQPTGDWPMLGGSAARTFYSASEQRLAPPLSVAWQLTNEAGWALNSPAIVDGVAYVGGYDAFYALDLERQTILWTRTLSTDNELSSPAVADGRVYVGNWAGDVFALDAATGAVVWATSVADPDMWPQVYSPAVVDGKVIVTVEAFRPDAADPTYQPHVLSVFALDAATGAEVWRNDLAAIDGYSSISDPVVVDGVVYVGTRDQGLFALDLATGAQLWRADHPLGADYALANFDGYLTVQAGQVIVAYYFNDAAGEREELHAFDAATGAATWMYRPVAPDYRLASSVLAYNGNLYLWLSAPGDSSHKDLAIVRAADGAQIARYAYSDDGADGGWWWQAAANGVLYRSSASIRLQAFSLLDGALLDVFEIGNSIQVPPALGAGYLIVPDEVNNLWVFGGSTGAHGICGVVFSDNNLNGVRDAGEPGISGATVTLTGTTDEGAPVSASMTTDSSGEFGFSNVAPGVYTLTETDPPGYRSVAAQAGSAGGVVVDANTIADIVLGAEASSVDNNFGDVQPVDITGTVFLDSDLNGVRDEGEPALAGVTITLTGGSEALTTSSDANGDFAFLQVLPGSYVLHETNPPGYFSTTLDDLPVTAIYPGRVYAENDFGDAPYIQIGGVVFVDANLDGVRQPEEAGLAGAMISLSGTTYRGQPVTAAAVSVSDGSYLWTDLLPGNYTVTEVDPPGYFSTSPNTSAVVAAIPGQRYDADFGDAQYVTVTGVVFDDVDLDGVRGDNVGLPGVAIDVRGTNYLGQLAGASAVTGEDGSFAFPALLPGNYRVVETNPEGYFSTTRDFVDVTLPAPGTAAVVEFGDARYATLSGAVYFDRNRNGQWDPGEPPLAGPTVTLSGNSYNGRAEQRTATAASDGSFTFAELLPGAYALAETDLPIFESVAANVGSAGGAVVDANHINDISLGASAVGVNYRFGDVTPPPQVQVSKELVTPASGQAQPGGEVAFRITVTNSGQTSLSQLPLRDQYETGRLAYMGADLAPDDGANDGDLTWTDLTELIGRDLAPGESAQVIVRFQAIQGSTAGSPLRALPIRLPGPATPIEIDRGRLSVPGETVAPNCALTIALEATCEGWSVQFDRTVSQAIPWRVSIDSTVIAEGRTRGNEQVNGPWPTWVDLSVSHTLRAEIQENGRWYGRSIKTPICAASVRTRNLALVSNAVDVWGVAAPDVSDDAWVTIGQASIPTPTPTPPWVQQWEGSLGPDEAVCLREPQWITVTGVVTLTPPNSSAYLQTTWRVVHPTDALCPPEAQPCTAEHYDMRQIRGTTTFTIRAWWPGIRADDEIVEIHYGANILDARGNPIHNGIGKDIYWYPWVCPPTWEEAGLLGAYYKPGGKVTNYPNWDALTPYIVQVDPQINVASTKDPFNGIAGLVDDFAVRWRGKIAIANAGRYRFYTQSDDGSRLYIDGRLVVRNDGTHGMTERSGSIELGSGFHDIEVWFFERSGKAGIVMSWTPPGGDKEVVPETVLYHSSEMSFRR